MSGRLFLAAWLIMISIMAFGFLKYPNAPIREHGGKYYDKTGNEFSIDDFREFKMWEATLIGGAITFFCVMILSKLICGHFVDKSENTYRLRR